MGNYWPNSVRKAGRKHSGVAYRNCLSVNPNYILGRTRLPVSGTSLDFFPPPLLILCLCRVTIQSYNDVYNLLFQRYLEKYYNFTSNGQQVFRSRISNPMAKKIREMQTFIGLQVTGEIDSNTLRAIQKPRCGNPDVGQFSFFSGQPKWQKKHPTYRILNYTPDMEKDNVDKVIAKAFKVWSRVTPLTFKKVPGYADIFISFHSGDFYPFDGPGETLAHACISMVLTLEEIMGVYNMMFLITHLGTNLFYVAVHEFGYSLGLFHSQDPNDDIAGIQYLYGNLESILKVLLKCFQRYRALKQICVFNRYFWRKHSQYRQIDLNLISEFWSFLPSRVDAVSENNEKDEAFLKKVSYYYIYQGDYLLPGYPKSIHSLGLPKDVTKIDAAVFSANEKKTYYFSLDRYWSYDENSKTMKRKPQRIQDGFPGISGKIDAVFHYNDVLYFLKRRNQYEFDPNTKRVTRILKADSWFSC
uniref:Collagenase 3 n=1 Tax=Pseudonaja textilis TaxID=8673 RepID=A0A670YEE4_PSETE